MMLRVDPQVTMFRGIIAVSVWGFIGVALGSRQLRKWRVMRKRSKRRTDL
jgi:hypothetical protein